jgi:hypothetical protein
MVAGPPRLQRDLAEQEKLVTNRNGICDAFVFIIRAMTCPGSGKEKRWHISQVWFLRAFSGQARS